MTQTITVIGRAKYANPDLGFDVTDGGTALHAALTAMHTAAANNTPVRFISAQTIANAAYVDVTHNFTLSAATELTVSLYISGAEITDYTGWTFTRQSDDVLRITNGTGSSKTVDVLVSCFQMINKNAQTLYGKKTFANGIIDSTLTASQLAATDASKNIVSLPVATYPSLAELEYVKGLNQKVDSTALPTFTRGSAITQTFNPAAAQDIQSAQKKTGLNCDGNGDFAVSAAVSNLGVGTSDATIYFAVSTDTSAPSEVKFLGYLSSGFYINQKVGSLELQIVQIGNSARDTGLFLVKDQVHTAIFTRSGGKIRLYLDGKASADFTESPVSVPSTPQFYVSYATTNAWQGSIYRAGLLNYALPEDKISRYSAGERLDWEDIGGSMTPITSGVIVVGIRYKITVNGGSGIFTNVGAAANTVGTEFIATGTTPTAWTGSELIRLGALAAYEGENLLPSAGIWPDSSGNANDLTITGATTINSQDSLEIKDRLIVGGDTKLAAKFGCNNVTPPARATVNAACTDLTTAVALVNQLRTALINSGICQ